MIMTICAFSLSYDVAALINHLDDGFFTIPRVDSPKLELELHLVDTLIRSHVESVLED